jgi:hypothetical protein
MIGRLAAIVLALLVAGGRADAQVPTGHVSVFLDYLPNRADTVEVRSRLFVEEMFEPGAGFRVRLSGIAEGLLARRPVPGIASGVPVIEPARVTAGVLRVQDANVEWMRGPVDLTAGFARVVWGKLDELQPTDVVNPLDVSRFFFEGRNEARLPVVVVRGRWFPSDGTTVEAIYVPAFRRGRFDQLDEPSSPFNLAVLVAPALPCAGESCGPVELDVSAIEPAITFRNAQGGGRFSTTLGRVDWSVSAYRGFEPFALYRSPEIAVPGPVLPVDGSHPRFTMIGSDFEAVRGLWGLRGEVAAYVEDSFQSADVRVVSGSSFDAGAGVDRRAGDFTMSGTVLFHSESYDEPVQLADGDTSTGRRDVSFIGSADRTFARERFRLRTFGLYNATEATAFVRVIGTMSLRDNVTMEASAGWFVGRGRDLVGRFSDNDFGYVRMRYDF